MKKSNAKIPGIPEIQSRETGKIIWPFSRDFPGREFPGRNTNLKILSLIFSTPCPRLLGKIRQVTHKWMALDPSEKTSQWRFNFLQKPTTTVDGAYKTN